MHIHTMREELWYSKALITSLCNNQILANICPFQAQVLSMFSSHGLIQSVCCRKNTNRHATTL